MERPKYDNSGSIAKNKRREKDTHPELSGSATIAGVDYWISGWKMDSEANGIWYSLRFKPKDKKRGSDDDIPL